MDGFECSWFFAASTPSQGYISALLRFFVLESSPNSRGRPGPRYIQPLKGTKQLALHHYQLCLSRLSRLSFMIPITLILDKLPRTFACA
jgi:hypothetical protein